MVYRFCCRSARGGSWAPSCVTCGPQVTYSVVQLLFCTWLPQRWTGTLSTLPNNNSERVKFVLNSVLYFLFYVYLYYTFLVDNIQTIEYVIFCGCATRMVENTTVYLLVVKGAAGITPLFNTHLAAGRGRVEMWGRVFKCVPFFLILGLMK